MSGIYFWEGGDDESHSGKECSKKCIMFKIPHIRVVNMSHIYKRDNFSPVLI